MKIIQQRRFFDYDSCTRYELDNISHAGTQKHLTACYLLTTHPRLKIQSLAIDPVGKDGGNRDRLYAKTFVDCFKSLDEFVRKYDGNCESWHLQMTCDGLPISFGAYGHNAEIGCTCHNHCDIDVDDLMSWVERESN